MVIRILDPQFEAPCPFLSQFFSPSDVEEEWGWDGEGQVLSVCLPCRPAHLPLGPFQVQEQSLHPQPLALRWGQRLWEQRG